MSVLSPELSPSQALALETLSRPGNVFLTGEAGSGKSFTIRHFLRDKDSKRFPVLASTGAAAVLIGGRTFHSFMGLGILEGGVEATVQRALRDRRLVKRINEAEGFILDEVSMISGPTLRAADTICRWAREKLHEPWGGLKVVAVGDFAQLPPVDHAAVRPWAFLDTCWEESAFQAVMLRQNMRTRDPEYLAILNDVRSGLKTDRVYEFLLERQELAPDDFLGTRLFPRRNQAEEFNLRKLRELEGLEIEFPSIYSGQERYVQQLQKYSPLGEKLILKVGAYVMFRQNDPRQRWVNGSTGTVMEIDETSVRVELLNGRDVRVEKTTFSLLDAEGQPVASVTNFPLSLAYAATIHKAQGMTIDFLMVNLRRLWEPGQAYVALSRVTEGRNLYVEDFSMSSILCDPLVQKFYRRIEATSGNFRPEMIATDGTT